MDLGIAGRTAIVCASSRGLGKACAHALAQAGVNVVINGRDEEKLAAAVKVISSDTDVDVTPVAADVSTTEGQKALLAAASAPDILVNNNGGPPRKDYSELDREAMVNGVVMNMVTPIELVQAVIGPMMDRNFGRIINITSASVKHPLTGLDLSSGARAGLTAFLAGVARQVAPHNVTINNILPGAFDTDRLNAGLQGAAKSQGVPVEKIIEQRKANIPSGRFGHPDEFGNACAFLCSTHASYITGQNLLIDGGDFDGAF